MSVGVGALEVVVGVGALGVVVGVGAALVDEANTGGDLAEDVVDHANVWVVDDKMYMLGPAVAILSVPVWEVEGIIAVGSAFVIVMSDEVFVAVADGEL